MTLLEFARGPALTVALAVFAAGTLWRLIAILRLPGQRDRSPPREPAASPWSAALRANVRAMWPRREFTPYTRYLTFNDWAFHVGAVMYVAAALTFVTLGIALVMRFVDPVRRRLSRADDFISWTVTFLPMITGMAVVGEPSSAITARGGEVIYTVPVAVHLLSLELLLVWFPFGKLMHAVLFAFARGATGMRFAHRGVRW
jgi:hypothetical protein